MSLTEKMAIKIGNNVKLLLDVDGDMEQIIIYGAINLFQIIFAILWVVFVGLLLGVLYESLIFSITTGVLRKYSGGAHASSPSRCIIIGTFLAAIAGISVDKILYQISKESLIIVILVFLIISFIIILKNAPVDSVKKPITNIQIRKQLKKASVIAIFIFSCIITILFILTHKYTGVYYVKIIECISLGVMWQSITLTKSGISLLNKVDFVLRYISEGGESHEK